MGHSEDTTATTERTLGVTGIVIFLVGLVVGISVFILPGSLAATTGPAVILSYGIAGIMAIFGCIVSAQVGVVFPVSGASFVAVSRILGPMWGFLGIWLLIGSGAVTVALLGFGFSDYMGFIWPGIDRQVGAVTLLVGLCLLNVFGLRGALLGQTLMVAAFMLALGVFCVAGLVNLDTSLLVPFVPNGMSPVIAAAIPAFFSYTGFGLVIEIGGEIKTPSRTIPLALLLSFLIVFSVYALVGIAVVGIIPWQELGGISAPVGEASSRILPQWLSSGISLTAVAAAASSVNFILLGYSRDVLALARVRTLPEVLAKISQRHHVPVNGVLFIAGLSLVAISVGGNIADVASLIVFAVLLLQIAMAVVMLQIPSKMPVRYEQAGFRMHPWVHKFFGVGLIIFSLFFMGVTAQGNIKVILIGSVYVLFGALYYSLRRAYLRRRNVHIDLLIQREVEAIR